MRPASLSPAESTTLSTAHHGRDFVQHLVVFGEPPGLVFTVNQVTVGADVKDAAPTFDQLAIDAELVFDRIRQTGGLRVIVSFYTILDRDSHRLLPGLTQITELESARLLADRPEAYRGPW